MIDKINRRIIVVQDDLYYDDFIKINKQLLIIFTFRSFKLIILIFLISYFVGIFWYIICNFNRYWMRMVEIIDEQGDGFHHADEEGFVT